MPLVRPYTLRKVHSHTLPLSELRTVSDPADPFHIDNFHRLITPATAHELTFPRVLRNKQRVARIEKELEDELMNRFSGMTEDQRTVVLRVLEENKKVREGSCAGKDAEKENNGDGKKEDGVDIHFPVVAAPLMGKDDDGLDGQGITVLSGSNIDEETKQDPAAQASLARKPPTPTLAQKYSQLVSPHRSPAEPTPAALPTTPTTTTALNSMKSVANTLKTWVQTTLDTPTIFDSESPLATSPPPPTTTDTDGFDILLNACKPAILESKPSTRLHVVREAYPDEKLIRSLEAGGAMSGTGRRKRIRRNRSSEKPAQTDIKSMRGKMYGAWYVRPTMWAEFMKKNEEENEKKKYGPKASCRRFGQLVQTTLNTMIANRAREDAQIALLFQNQSHSHSQSIMPARPRTQGGVDDSSGGLHLPSLAGTGKSMMGRARSGRNTPTLRLGGKHTGSVATIGTNGE